MTDDPCSSSGEKNPGISLGPFDAFREESVDFPVGFFSVEGCISGCRCSPSVIDRIRASIYHKRVPGLSLLFLCVLIDVRRVRLPEGMEGGKWEEAGG